MIGISIQATIYKVKLLVQSTMYWFQMEDRSRNWVMSISDSLQAIDKIIQAHLAPLQIKHESYLGSPEQVIVYFARQTP